MDEHILLDNRFNELNKIINKIKLFGFKKNKFINSLLNINDNDNNISNVIMITDYEITSKISCYYINSDTPLTKNSNTYCIHTYFASYIYIIISNMLLSINYREVCTKGEYSIPAMYLYDIVEELSILFNEQYLHLKYLDPIKSIQELIIGLLNNTLDKNLYDHLLSLDNIETLINKPLIELVHPCTNKYTYSFRDQYLNIPESNLISNQDLINDEFIETKTQINEQIYSDDTFNDNVSDIDSDNDKQYKNNINKYD